MNTSEGKRFADPSAAAASIEAPSEIKQVDNLLLPALYSPLMVSRYESGAYSYIYFLFIFFVKQEGEDSEDEDKKVLKVFMSECE